jgi:myo-inositol-1(or 4)-monophosphatase
MKAVLTVGSVLLRKTSPAFTILSIQQIDSLPSGGRSFANLKSISSILSFARGTVSEAGRKVRGYCGCVLPERKPDGTIVTEADRISEDLIVSRIHAAFPDHSILGEEKTTEIRDWAGPLWIIDPIDGTSSFVRGMPIWGVSLGYFENCEPVAGVFYMPKLDECYWATAEGAAFLNGEPIAMADPEQIDSESVMAVGSDFHRVAVNRFPGKVRSFGSLAANLCYVARGSVTAAVSSRTRIWDIAAGGLIVQCAGGVLRFLDGRSLDWRRLLAERKTLEFLVAGHSEVISEVSRYIEPLPPEDLEIASREQ